MESSIALLGLAVILFAGTNVDDLFVLLGFFSDPRFDARHIVIGQCLGITVVYGVSVLASALAIVIPPAYVGLLGLGPIFLGGARLYALWRGAEADNDGAIVTTRRGSTVSTVALATLANGSDNISVYTPVFATHPARDVAAMGLVFAVMTAIWCFIGHWLVHHPRLGAPIRRYGPMMVPFILIGFGILILWESGTFNVI